ncbi:MAG: PIN domain-containing protein [Geodermatophilaceae bacterium]|nr:PIN domain-containing protein [Geodermatophilaceae bacterium]
MIALDSSVVVASFGAWHERHVIARETLADSPALPAHAALEAYSVLTRLPEPFRAEPLIVAEFLERGFSSARLVLDARHQAALPARLAGLGISGGAVYDALIAFTAGAADAEIVTLDRRAFATYQLCDVTARLLA